MAFNKTEHHRQYMRQWRKEHPNYYVEIQRQWHKKNPKASSARKRVSDALNSGTLKRGLCLSCGAEKVEAHHHDYSKPLDVVWLCRQCHADAHRIAK